MRTRFATATDRCGGRAERSRGGSWLLVLRLLLATAALSPVLAKADAVPAGARQIAEAPPPAASASTVHGPKPVPTGLVAMGRLAFAFRSGEEPDQGFAALA